MPERSSRSRQVWKAVALMVPALAIGFWLPGHISITLTPSLGHRVFLLTEPENKNFRTGDYLLFHKQLEHASTENPLQKNMLLLKMVGCAPGQQLKVKGGVTFCNENYLGHVLDQDSKGRKLPQFIFNDVVPAGSLFMIGSHPRSYDSKYFGFIHAKSVIKKAYPLW